MSADNQRRGPLSAEEKADIKQSCATEPIDDIAARLQRNPKTVGKYVKECGLQTKDFQFKSREETEIINHLHSLEWWTEIDNQFTSKEVRLFEQVWVRLYRQFDQDILPSEEIQLRKYITLEIMKDRSLKEIKKTIEDIDSVDQEYRQELSKDPSDRDRDLIRSFRETLSNHKNSIPTLNKQYQELNRQQGEVEKGLVGSRDQRIKNIQDANKNWSAVLKMLEEPKTRKEVGKFIEIMRVARDKEMARLTQFHTFVDKSIDKPILSGKDSDD